MSHSAGFKRLTRLDTARDRLLDIVTLVERTTTVRLGAADGRVLAEPIDATRDVPHYTRAAMDGFAVRAADTFGASEHSPALLRVADEAGPDAATPVHTGSPVPADADAVVMVEHVERFDDDLELASAGRRGRERRAGR